MPVERIERSATAPRNADDRHINKKATAAVLSVLSNNPLKDAPFYTDGVWHFVTHNSTPRLNVADPLPDEVAKDLASETAAQNGREMPTSLWRSILRNSLAHGGIAYLDEDGKTTFGRPVKMYLFASDIKGGLGLLRITEIHYRMFLGQWVKWLHSAGVT